MPEILSRLASPDALTILAYVTGIYCLATVLGIVGEVPVGKYTLHAPVTRAGKIVMSVVGVSLIAIGIGRSLTFPEYLPTVFESTIYRGKDAEQIVADGEEVYLLKKDGSIYKIAQNELIPVDENLDTAQISPGGGVLYGLKHNGNIEVYRPASGRPAFSLTKDDGTNTSQILSVGETLYVLKRNGNIYKSSTPATGLDVGTVAHEYIMIDDGMETREITSSGSILYVLKNSGNIWSYAPTLGQSFQQIYSNGDVEQIKADGATLYFIRNGTPCRYRENYTVKSEVEPRQEESVKQQDPCLRIEETKCFIIKNAIRAKRIDALGGVLYILTNENTIFRYNAETDTVRELKEAGDDNQKIAAYYQDLFVIKTDGSVRRYNEGRLKR